MKTSRGLTARISIAAVAAALLTVGAAANGQGAIAADGCADVYFYGARGSGASLTEPTRDKASPVYGFGAEVARLYGLWRNTVPAHVKVDTMYNTYPAESTDALTKLPKRHILDPLGFPSSYWYGDDGSAGAQLYFTSINQGVELAVTQLQAKHLECRDAKFVLAGYSQGAMVMHHAELALEDQPVADSVVGTFLIADGDRRGPDNQARLFGSASPGSYGIRTWAKLVGGLSDSPESPPIVDVASPNQTADICAWRDPICDFVWDSSDVKLKIRMPIHTETYEEKTDTFLPKAVAALGPVILAQIPAAVPITIPAQSITGTVGEAVDHRLQANGGDRAYTWTFTNLPPGVVGDAGGLLTGTPTQSGAFDIDITVTDGHLQTGTGSVRLTVAPAPVRLTFDELADFTRVTTQYADRGVVFETEATARVLPDSICNDAICGVVLNGANAFAMYYVEPGSEGTRATTSNSDLHFVFLASNISNSSSPGPEDHLQVTAFDVHGNPVWTQQVFNDGSGTTRVHLQIPGVAVHRIAINATFAGSWLVDNVAVP